jgi:hypothetical protein
MAIGIHENDKDGGSTFTHNALQTQIPKYNIKILAGIFLWMSEVSALCGPKM